jgi:hypothetical protein
MSKHLTKYIEKWEAEKSLSVPEQHQKSIAIKTLKMPDAMVGIMGGMDKDEARKFLKSIGYTDTQVRKLEARQASSRVVIAKELVKIANKKTQGSLNMNRIAVARELVKLARELTAGERSASIWTEDFEEEKRLDKLNEERRETWAAAMSEMSSLLKDQNSQFEAKLRDVKSSFDYNPKRDGHDENVEKILAQLKDLGDFFDRQKETGLRRLDRANKEAEVYL